MSWRTGCSSVGVRVLESHIERRIFGMRAILRECLCVYRMCTSTSMYVCVNFTRLFEDTSVLINTIRIFEYLYAYVVATY